MKRSTYSYLLEAEMRRFGGRPRDLAGEVIRWKTAALCLALGFAILTAIIGAHIA